MADRHVQSVDGEPGVLHGVDGPPEDPATADIHPAAAAYFPFPHGLFGDFADPEFIEPRSSKAAFDQIITRGYSSVLSRLGWTEESVETSAMHQSPGQPLADANDASLNKFSTPLLDP